MTDSDSPDACVAHPIARSGIGTVAACRGCGNVQLSLEYLTLRFQPAAFRELVGLLVLAQSRLDRTAAAHAGSVPEPLATAGRGPADEPVH